MFFEYSVTNICSLKDRKIDLHLCLWYVVTFFRKQYLRKSIPKLEQGFCPDKLSRKELLFIQYFTKYLETVQVLIEETM